MGVFFIIFLVSFYIVLISRLIILNILENPTTIRLDKLIKKQAVTGLILIL